MGAQPRRTAHRRAGASICSAKVLLAAVVLLGRLATAWAHPLVSAVDAVAMTVSDVDRSVAFYSDVLGFEPVSDVEVSGEQYARLEGVPGMHARMVRMRLGDESIELTESLTPRGRPIPVDSRSNDRWFQHIAIIVSDMDRAYQWLRQSNVEPVSAGPQTLPEWNAAAAGIRAFYFRDPDQHVLEILQFPAGKGDGKWHRPTGELFLGIDHTAIVVADTDASLRFYRNVLGLVVAGESENYGEAQERLNNVRGARLRITGLRAAAGPGIELLEYLSPRDGRALPDDQRANDVAHWQTRLIAADVQQASRLLGTAGYRFISPDVIELPGDRLGFHSGMLVRDPDGHAMELVPP